MSWTPPRRVTSTATTITVQSNSLPYTLPAAGYAKTIGTNTADGIKPGVYNTTQWQAAMFGSFGGGTVIEDYSAYGAYVVAGSGGHNSNDGIGGLAFDFADATWKLIPPSGTINGLNWRPQAYDDTTEVNSEAEVTVSGVVGNLPTPCHPYGNALELPEANGGGTKGSYVIFHRASGGAFGNRSSGRAMRFDLATGQWSRFTSTAYTIPGDIGTNQCSVFDKTANRYLKPPGAFAGGAFTILTLSNQTWSTSASYSAPSPAPTNGINNATMYEPGGTRWLVHVAVNDSKVFLIDVDNIGAGWKQTPFTGSVVKNDPNDVFRHDKWAYYPVNGKFYTRPDSGSIHELSPPSGDPTTQPWTLTTKTFLNEQTGLPLTIPDSDTGTGSSHHSTRFFYVPSIQCLAWIPGVSSSVYLMKP